MRKLRKARVEFKFIKQQLYQRVLEENLELFTMLDDKEDTIGAQNKAKIEKVIFNGLKSGVKSSEYQEKRVMKLADRLEKLHKWQLKRRNGFLDWVTEYLDNIECREERDFKDKYCTGADEMCLQEFLNYDHDGTLLLDEEETSEADDIEGQADTDLSAPSETEVSEEDTNDSSGKDKKTNKLVAFFGEDENCGE